MNFHFDYSKAIGRMKMMSSFEGRNAVSGDGSSNYLQVKITEQDEPIIKEYAVTAALQIEENIARVVRSSDYSDDGFTWDLDLDTPRWNNKRNLNMYVEEAVVAYSIMKWVEENRPERLQPFQEIFNDMMVRVVDCVFRLRAPIKRRRPKIEGTSVEIVTE